MPDDPGAWVLSSRLLDADENTVGGTLPISTSTGPCAPRQQPEQAGRAASQQAESAVSACFTELNRLGYRHEVTYQPSSRFWAFQWYETVIYLGLAVGLTGFSFWRIRRRLS